MSHQTGIQANEELRKFFAKCANGKVRAAKICIENEQLVLVRQCEAVSDWQKDYNKMILPLVADDEPCYMIYRLDSKNDSGHDWLFVSWCPDTSPVRQKMLYASTKATLKQEFGSSHIKEEIHCTVKEDCTLEGYYRGKREAADPAPLTIREEELNEIKRTESHTDYGVDSRHQTLGGVAFPIDSAAKSAVLDMASGTYTYLQFKIDLDEEQINLVCAEILDVERLSSKVPDNAARYHLFRFKYTHEGDYTESLVFIYSMPGYSCSIKERMLYASCKNPLTEIITSLGLTIDKKLEVDGGKGLNAKFLYEELHPTKCLHRPQFARPKGPPGRGPKRMTKAAPADN